MLDNSRETRIAIIGAGVSGLASAVALMQAGCTNITIYEARREAGGRTRSHLDPVTGDTLDNGQHLLAGCYSNTLEYLEIIGTRDKIERSNGLNIRFYGLSGNPRELKISSLLPSPLNLAWGLWRTDLLSLNDKLAATSLGNSIRSGRLPRDLDAMTCDDLFESTNQPRTLIRKLWEPITLATINAPTFKASATLFVNVFKAMFFSVKGGSDLLIPTVGLSKLLVGPALQKLVDAGVKIHCGSPVAAISEDAEVTVDGALHKYDQVIYAAPASNALPASVLAAMPPIALSPIVNGFFWTDRKILTRPINAFISSSLQWGFPKQSVYSAQLLALTVSAASDLVSLTPEEIKNMLWSELRQAVPEASGATLLKYQIIKERRATPLFDVTTQKRRPETMTRNSRLLLAGDIVQNGLPATIEGAISNGFAAARAVLERALL